MIDQIRTVEAALGSRVKAPVASELPVRALVRRSVTLAHDVRAGHRLRPDDLVLLRPGDGIAPASLHEVPGRVVIRDLQAGTTLSWADLD